MIERRQVHMPNGGFAIWEASEPTRIKVRAETAPGEPGKLVADVSWPNTRMPTESEMQEVGELSLARYGQ